jgi:hypothetical protein
MSFDPNIARPSAGGLVDTYIPLGSDETPSIRQERTIKRTERAKARFAVGFDLYDQIPKINPERYSKV